MKIAITATGKDLEAQIAPRFGRAQYILIVDNKGTIIDVIDNESNRGAMARVGITAAKMLSDRNVSVLLTGRCGSNAVAALTAAGIEIGEVGAGTARNALERFNRGEISYVKDAPGSAMRTPGLIGARRSGAGRGVGTGRGRGRGTGRGMGRGGGIW